MTLTVSAVIATYNRGPELRIALTRLMNQTTPPMEIIVIDDGSSDGTGAMMRAEFPTVRYVRQPHNGGLILARALAASPDASRAVLRSAAELALRAIPPGTG